MLPICMSAMDACWVYVIGWVLSGTLLEKVAQLPVPSPLALAGVSLVAWGLSTFLLNRTKLPTWLIQVVAMVAGLEVSLGVMVIVGPPGADGISIRWVGEAVLGLILCFTMWLRGLYHGASPLTFNDIYFNFQLGLVIVVLGALVAPLFIDLHFGAQWGQVATLPIWYFIFSLVALALGNREVVRLEIGRVVGRSWGVVLTVSIALIVLVGTLSALLGGPNLLGLVQQLVELIIVAISGAIYGVLYGILWLWYVLFKPQLSPIGSAPATPTPGGITDQSGLQQLQELLRGQRESTDMPPELLQVASWLAVLLVASFALLLVSMGLRRFRNANRKRTEEEREGFGSWELLRAQLQSFLARLLARFRRKRPVAAVTERDDLASLMGRPEWSGTLTIRQIYARLLSAAARVGYPRARSQTPVEYLAVLSSALPTLGHDFRAITAAYLEARYGPLPAPAPVVAEATDAWQRVEPELRHLAADGANSSGGSTTKQSP